MSKFFWKNDVEFDKFWWVPDIVVYPFKIALKKVEAIIVNVFNCFFLLIYAVSIELRACLLFSFSVERFFWFIRGIVFERT